MERLAGIGIENAGCVGHTARPEGIPNLVNLIACFPVSIKLHLLFLVVAVRQLISRPYEPA